MRGFFARDKPSSLMCLLLYCLLTVHRASCFFSYSSRTPSLRTSSPVSLFTITATTRSSCKTSCRPSPRRRLALLLSADDDAADNQDDETDEEEDDDDVLEELGLLDDDDDDYDEDSVEYEKFEIATGDTSDLPPLPPFYMSNDDDLATTTTTTSSSSSSSSSSSNDVLDETQRQIQEQQRQIDLLMKMVQSKTTTTDEATATTASNSSTAAPLPPLPNQEELEEEEEESSLSSSSDANVMATTPSNINVAPLKAMLFIDGTWLYYSIHERREQDCPIVRKYGRGWQHRYRFDWAALPRIVCEQMQQQQAIQGWSSTETNPLMHRQVEIVRASVFTSIKTNTAKKSFRVRMFEDMANANYDIHMFETLGKGEKCVDIQLAVEMLHYATVPNAYDVAILLSGDKDFMPALVRTRQKGRKVCVVSMRTGCNRALYESPNVKDFDVVWIEDFLDRLIVPLKKEEMTIKPNESLVSTFTLNKAVSDFINKSGKERVSSRDVGRFLKAMRIGDRTMLEEVKLVYGGLHTFLSMGDCFTVTRAQKNSSDPRDRAYWISLRPEAERFLMEEARNTNFNEAEKDFFGSYSLEALDDKTSAYYHSMNPTDSNFLTPRKFNYPEQQQQQPPHGGGTTPELTLPEEVTKDYSQCTVVQLKERCRERGLPVSGTKVILLERVQNDVNEQIATLNELHATKQAAAKPVRTINGGNDIPSSSRTATTLGQNVDPEVAQHLKDLVKEYLQASGGHASSRDLGRYLTVNADSGRMKISLPGEKRTALSELKDQYGNLVSFIQSHADTFAVKRDTDNMYGFMVFLRDR